MVLQVSQAARSGLLAAYLAEQGARASATSLEGPIGFYYAFTGGTEGIDTSADHLGSRWEIMDVTLKRYPTSMFNQPPIHVMLALTERHDLRPEQIESVLVEMNDFETNYPSATFRRAGYRRGGGSGATNFVVAAACVNRGFSIPPDRPAGWTSPVQGIDRLPSHPASLSLAERVTGRRLARHPAARPAPDRQPQGRHHPPDAGDRRRAEAQPRPGPRRHPRPRPGDPRRRAAASSG